jgi:8-oxo-dGTP diphosphatase
MKNKVSFDVVKLVIYNNNKFLLQHRDDKSNISNPGAWSFFGGKVEKNEDLEKALKREIFEELHWTPSNINFLKEKIDGRLGCRVMFYITLFSENKKILKLKEGQGMGWFTFNQIKNKNFGKIASLVMPIIKESNLYLNKFKI